MVKGASSSSVPSASISGVIVLPKNGAAACITSVWRAKRSSDLCISKPVMRSPEAVVTVCIPEIVMGSGRYLSAISRRFSIRISVFLARVHMQTDMCGIVLVFPNIMGETAVSAIIFLFISMANEMISGDGISTISTAIGWFVMMNYMWYSDISIRYNYPRIKKISYIDRDKE